MIATSSCDTAPSQTWMFVFSQAPITNSEYFKSCSMIVLLYWPVDTSVSDYDLISKSLQHQKGESEGCSFQQKKS